MQEQYHNLKVTVDTLLHTNSSIKSRVKNTAPKEKDLFVGLIQRLELLQTRSNILFTDLKIDYSSYDETFLEIIDTLLFLKYGKDDYELISFYLWERTNPDGSINELYDEQDKVVPLNNINDLWELVQKFEHKIK